MTKEDKKDISVIIICYNPDIEKLKNTLISTLKQKDVNFDIVIADDGSSISYEKDIREWFSNIKPNIDIKYSFLQKNVGTVENIYRALDLCESDYIKTISPGDYFLSNSSLFNYVKAFADQNADVVFSDSIYYYENTILKKRQYPHNRNLFHSKNLSKTYRIYSTFFLGATIASKKKAFEDAVTFFNHKVKFLEDFLLINYSFAFNLKVFGFDQPLVWYESGTGISTSSKRNQKLVDDSYVIFDVLKDNFKDDKVIKRMVKIHDIQNLSLIKKVFAISFCFPLFYYYRFKRMVLPPKKYNYTINDLTKDITL